MGTGRVKLIDYIAMRKTTDEHGLHPLVRLDSYELTILVLHREISHEDIYHVLAEVMKVPVHNCQRIGRPRGVSTVESGECSSRYQPGQ